MNNTLFHLILATTFAFTAAKIFGWLEWSWVWVLSPLWVSIALTWFLFCIFFIVGMMIEKLKD